MAHADDVRNALRKWVKVLDDPEVAKDFEGYNKTMQLVFPDIEVKMQLVFEGPKTKIIDGFKEDADMSLTIDSDMFMGITSGDIDPMDAFMEGKLKPKGEMPDL
jgi:putative sterol carrier protein